MVRTSPPKGRRRPWRLLLVASVSAVVTLAVAEVVCRWQVHRANQRTLRAALSEPSGVGRGEDASFRDIVRPSLDRRIAFELEPDLDVTFEGEPLRTNAQGFRSPELDDGPAAGVTILGIGDSFMFGHGVGDGESYMGRLRQLLEKAYPEVPWRVINTAVPGYNTVMEVATLEAKGLGYEPDLVILGVYGNDYVPPAWVRLEEDVLDPTRSFFLEFLRAGFAQPAHDAGNDPLVYRRTWARKTHDDAEAAPEGYEDLHGPASFRAALDHLAELAHEHGFDVLAFSADDSFDAPEMMAACAERGFHCVRLQPDIDAAVLAATGQPYSAAVAKTRRPAKPLVEADLVVSTDNLHLSVRGHALAAARLMRALDELGYVARWTGGR